MISKPTWILLLKKFSVVLAVLSPLILIISGYVIISHYSVAIPSITTWLLDYQIWNQLFGDFSITHAIIHSQAVEYILSLTEYKNTLRFLITLFLLILGITWLFRWFDILFSWMQALTKGCLWLIGNIPFFLWKTLIALWGIVFGKSIHSALWVWFKRYYSFLHLYSNDENIRYIFLTHIDSLWRVFIPRSIPRPTDWREYHEFKTPFDLRRIMTNFNRALNTVFRNEKHYITDLVYNDSGIHCSVNKGGDTYQELIEKISANKKEFTIHLPKMSTYDMGVITEDLDWVSFDIKIRLAWKSKKLPLIELEKLVRPWKVLIGFQMGTLSNPIVPFYYNISDLTSSIFLAETRAGKDNLILNFLFNFIILKKRWEEAPTIFLIDIKESDFKVFSCMGSLSIHRISSDMKEILSAFAFICEEIDRRYKMFWTASKIETWNILYPKQRLDHIIIYLNEAWIFLGNITDNGIRKILFWYIHKILMSGMWAGVKLMLLNQSGRALQFEWFWKMLASIPNRYVGKLANSSEYEIALGSSYSDRGKTIQKFNFLVVENSSITAEIRSYEIPQVELADFIDNDPFFERKDTWWFLGSIQNEESSEETESAIRETIKQDYFDAIDIDSLLQEAFSEWQLLRSLGMKWGVSEKRFPILKRILNELDIVEIKTWLACLVNKNMTAEEAIEKFNNRAK